MKNNIVKIFAVIVSSLILILIIFTGRTFKKYNESTDKTTANIQTTTEDAVNALESADFKALSVAVSEVFGKPISENLLQELDETTILSINENYKNNTLNADNWHEITGYSLNAFIDKFETKESKDMGNNEKDYFELGFVGDINFNEGSYVMPHANNMPNGVFDCIDETFQNEMKSVDIMLVNNEFTYSDRGSPMVGKKYTFRAKPESVNILVKLGVDIVSLANNHTYDYGYDSFIDTLDTLEKADLPYVGAGMNIDDAIKPVTFIINGYKVAYLAGSGVEYPIKTKVATKDSEGIVGTYDSGEMLTEAIRKAKETCDYIFVYPHWGMENTTDLTYSQQNNSKKYIDAGATAVVGDHPHILQGMEFYKNKLVVYSLGNFWFNKRDIYTGLLKFKISEDKIDPIFIPGRQKDAETHYLTDKDEQRSLFDKIEKWSPKGDIVIDDNGLIKEKGN